MDSMSHSKHVLCVHSIFVLPLTAALFNHVVWRFSHVCYWNYRCFRLTFTAYCRFALDKNFPVEMCLLEMLFEIEVEIVCVRFLI